MNNYYFPRGKPEEKVGPHSTTVRDLVGYSHLPIYLRELMDSSHLDWQKRLSLTTFLWANGVHPQIILDYYDEKKCLADESAGRHVLSVLQDCRSNPSFQRTSYTWDTVDQCYLYLDGSGEKELNERWRMKKKKALEKKKSQRRPRELLVWKKYDCK